MAEYDVGAAGVSAIPVCSESEARANFDRQGSTLSDICPCDAYEGVRNDSRNTKGEGDGTVLGA